VVQEARYLGSYATQAGTDLRDVEERISKASQAFGALKHCRFRQRDIAMLLFGAEHRCLTAKMVRVFWARRSSRHRPTQIGVLRCARSRAGARIRTGELGTFLLHTNHLRTAQAQVF
jgi:hypothetical protein